MHIKLFLEGSTEGKASRGKNCETTHNAIQMNNKHISAMVMAQTIESRHWKAMRASRGDLTCSQLAVPASWLHALFCPSYSHPPLSTRQDHHLGFHLVLVYFIWVIRIKCFALSILLSKSVTYPWPQDQLLWLTWFSYLLLFWICCSVGSNLVIHASWITVLMFI